MPPPRPASRRHAFEPGLDGTSGHSRRTDRTGGKPHAQLRPPRDLTTMLHGGSRRPFGPRPEMIGQPGRHRRAPPRPDPLGARDRRRPHRPAGFVAVQAQAGDPLAIPPALTGPVRPPGLPGILADPAPLPPPRAS